MDGEILDISWARLERLVSRYAGAGPRYTSYPPATEFRADFGAEQYRERLAALASDPEGRLSVYVHLPFCRSLCSYCGCNVAVVRSDTEVDCYLDSLETELELATRAWTGRRRLTQLHLGGGTPTLLTVAQLERLMELLGRKFSIDAETEVAVEIDPASTSQEQLAALRRLGFNRLSAGIQELDPWVQGAVKRQRPFGAIRDALHGARALGFRSLSVDLMYGLPMQTPAGLSRTLEKVVAELNPDRLAIYGYAHVPWHKPHQRRLEQFGLPSPLERVRLFLKASAFLREHGYAQIGLDHFAAPHDDLAVALREGRIHRNFQGYTAQEVEDTLALGASGIGDVRGAFVQNAHRLTTYHGELELGRLPVERGYVRTADDDFRRAVIDRLMCHLQVDLAGLAAKHGMDAARDLAPELARLEPLEADGLVHWDTDRGVLQVTETGRLFVRNAAMAFDRYSSAPAAEPLRPRFSGLV